MGDCFVAKHSSSQSQVTRAVFGASVSSWFSTWSLSVHRQVLCRIAACAMHGFSGVAICCHACTPATRPQRQRGAGHACEHYCAQCLHPCIYIHCCLAQWDIYWFSRVMHAAVRLPAYATYLGPGCVLPPMHAIWGLGPCGQGLSVQTAHELMHRIASRLRHACAKRNPCAATHTR